MSRRALSFSVTIWRDDGRSELDVDCTVTDAPDLSVGMRDYEFELDAGAAVLTDDERERALMLAQEAIDSVR